MASTGMKHRDKVSLIRQVYPHAYMHIIEEGSQQLWTGGDLAPGRLTGMLGQGLDSEKLIDQVLGELVAAGLVSEEVEYGW